jgi:hypothetical protein
LLIKQKALNLTIAFLYFSKADGFGQLKPMPVSLRAPKNKIMTSRRSIPTHSRSRIHFVGRLGNMFPSWGFWPQAIWLTRPEA